MFLPSLFPLSYNHALTTPKGSNCRSWDGGSLDVTSKSQNTIWAFGNQKVTSKSQTESLSKHVQNGFYGLDVTRATGGDEQNPFANLSSSSVSNTGIAPPRTKADKVLIAHGMVFRLAMYSIYFWLM